MINQPNNSEVKESLLIMIIQLLSYIPNSVNDDLIKVVSAFIDLVQEFMNEPLICVYSLPEIHIGYYG